MSRARVLLFGLLTAVFAMGYGVMFTVLDDFRDEYGIAERWLGMIVGIGFLTSFAAQVAIAPLGDRGWARHLLLVGAFCNIAGLLVMAAGSSLEPLLIGRLIAGLGTGMASPAVKRIVINADPAHLGNNLGTLFSADVAGFATGPAVSAILVPLWGLPAPFVAIAIATAVLIPVVLSIGVTSHTSDGDVLLAPKKWFAFDLLGSRAMVAALLIGVGVFLMIGTFDALWAIVLDDLGASDFVANIGVSLFALPIIVLGAVGGRLAQRWGPFRLGPLGLIVGAVFMVLYGLVPTGVIMLVVAAFQAIGDGLTMPSAGVAVGMVAPDDRQAGAQGLLGAAETLTGAVAAIVAGRLYESGGRELAYTGTAIIMVIIAGLSYALAGPTLRRPAGDAATPDATTPEDGTTGGGDDGDAVASASTSDSPAVDAYIDPHSGITGHA